MFKKVFLIGGIIISIAFTFVPPVFAEEPRTTSAEVVIYNARIDSQDGYNFALSFDIVSQKGTEKGVQYAVVLREKDGAIIDQLSFQETLTLIEKTPIHKEIQYAVTKKVIGNYELSIESRITDSFPLASVSLGDVRFEAPPAEVVVSEDSSFSFPSSSMMLLLGGLTVLVIALIAWLAGFRKGVMIFFLFAFTALALPSNTVRAESVNFTSPIGGGYNSSIGNFLYALNDLTQTYNPALPIPRHYTPGETLILSTIYSNFGMNVQGYFIFFHMSNPMTSATAPSVGDLYNLRAEDAVAKYPNPVIALSDYTSVKNPNKPGLTYAETGGFNYKYGNVINLDDSRASTGPYHEITTDQYHNYGAGIIHGDFAFPAPTIPGTYYIHLLPTATSQPQGFPASNWNQYMTIPFVVDPDTTQTKPNKPPSPPVITSSKPQGFINTSYDFTFTSTDPDGDKLLYQIDWQNKKVVSESLPSTNYYSSGTTGTSPHQFAIRGSLVLNARAKDDHGNLSEWSTYTFPVLNRAPEAPVITPSNNNTKNVGQVQTFSFLSIEPDNDNLVYTIDWGDGSAPSVSGVLRLNQTYTVTHIFSKTGSFVVKAKSKDNYLVAPLESPLSTLTLVLKEGLEPSSTPAPKPPGTPPKDPPGGPGVNPGGTPGNPVTIPTVPIIKITAGAGLCYPTRNGVSKISTARVGERIIWVSNATFNNTSAPTYLWSNGLSGQAANITVKGYTIEAKYTPHLVISLDGGVTEADCDTLNVVTSQLEEI